MAHNTNRSRHEDQPGALTVLAWTLAWGVMGAALYVSGVFNFPPTGPLWIALAGGALPWALAGALTFRGTSDAPSHRRMAANHLIWALAYLASFGLAAFLQRALADTLGGLLFTLAGWSLGAGIAAFASTTLLTPARVRQSGFEAVIWAVAFFAGGYVGLPGVYLLPEIAKLAVGSVLGIHAVLTLGSALGGAVGGLAASAIVLILTRLLRRLG